MVGMILYTLFSETEAAVCTGRLGLPEEGVQAHDFQSKLAHRLLEHGLSRFYGIGETPRLIWGDLGKPALWEHPEIRFNLSHTAGAVVCALASAEVGVDIEKLGPVRGKTAERLSLPSESPAFWEEWVRREAIIKYRGGSALRCRKPVALQAGETYQSLSIGDGFAAGLCTEETEETFQMIEVPLRDLLLL